jgi:hypothetical protein
MLLPPIDDDTLRSVLFRSRFFPLVVLLLGCSRPPAAAPTAPRDAAAPVEPCTLATPLVPGVPGSPGHLIRSDINPNGQSELAAHMRMMQAQLKAAGALIERGESGPPLHAAFAKIRCAWPTTPADRDEAFDRSAQAYLGAVQRLDRAGRAQRRAAFDGVLDACRACHEHTCSGAIVAIEALRLPPTQSR